MKPDLEELQPPVKHRKAGVADVMVTGTLFLP